MRKAMLLNVHRSALCRSRRVAERSSETVRCRRPRDTGAESGLWQGLRSFDRLTMRNPRTGTVVLSQDRGADQSALLCDRTNGNRVRRPVTMPAIVSMGDVIVRFRHGPRRVLSASFFDGGNKPERPVKHELDRIAETGRSRPSWRRRNWRRIGMCRRKPTRSPL